MLVEPEGDAGVVNGREQKRARLTWSQFFGMLVFPPTISTMCFFAVPGVDYLDGFLTLQTLWWPASKIAGGVGMAWGIYLVGTNGRVSGPFLSTAFVATAMAFAAPFIAPFIPLEPTAIAVSLLEFGVPLAWFRQNMIAVSPGSTYRSLPHFCFRAAHHAVRCAFIWSLALSAIYFNGQVTLDHPDGTRETIKVHESLRHIYRSPAVQDAVRTFWDIYAEGQQRGWGNVWEELVKKMDVDGSENAYYVLGLEKDTPFPEVKKRYRKLAKVFHPDKCSSEDCKEQFRELQDAYDILKTLEDKRKRRGARSGPSGRRKGGARRRKPSPRSEHDDL